jgi:hypothetical protein
MTEEEKRDSLLAHLADAYMALTQQHYVPLCARSSQSARRTIQALPCALSRL